MGVVSAARYSAAPLLRSALPHTRRLANSSGLVGRRYMAHLATMMQVHILSAQLHGVSEAVRSHYYRDPERGVSAQNPVAGQDPRVMHDRRPVDSVWPTIVGAGGVAWLVMSEDLRPRQPRDRGSGRTIRLHYNPNIRSPHHELVRETRAPRRLGFWLVVKHSQVSYRRTSGGTVRFVPDPRASLLESFWAHPTGEPVRRGRVVLPFVGAVNPA